MLIDEVVLASRKTWVKAWCADDGQGAVILMRLWRRYRNNRYDDLRRYLLNELARTVALDQ